eukprot:4358989-Lingulodinium_polyedra.AAC.2
MSTRIVESKAGTTSWPPLRSASSGTKAAGTPRSAPSGASRGVDADCLRPRWPGARATPSRSA